MNEVLPTRESNSDSIISVEPLNATKAVSLCKENNLALPLPATVSENDELLVKLETLFLDTGIEYFWLGAETDTSGDGAFIWC